MRRTSSALVLGLAILLEANHARAADGPAKPDPTLRSLDWREVGPYRGGRSAAVTGVPSQPDVYWFGSTGGGVWKTQDAGRTWRNASDGFFGGSIGAVAVSEWDPNVVYVGGGEKTVRGNVSHGDGVWKSVDAGATWRHVGLADSRHIPRIRIHPRDPDLVWAAVLGHLFGPSEARGVYRSSDGGATWSRVLHVNPDAGAIDLALDPTNPRVLYAAFWRVRRTPWSLESGGEGSGLWKTTDGGDTWTELTGKKGFPAAPLGIIGITVSPTNPKNLYSIVEAAEGGVFRSKDAGETWERTNAERKLRQRAWYYSRIYADPADEEALWVPNVEFHRSKDGGKTFTAVDTPHSDNHDLWIAPDDPRRMIEANDGGANVTFDGGKTWSPQSNQPTAQMYRVSTDDDFPYRLLGGQQDNTALRIRSRSAFGDAIGPRDWEPTAGGESGHVVAQPGEPDVVYGGSYGGYLVRLDHRTGDRRGVNPWPDNPMGWGAADLRYRFQWNYPIFFSPHDRDTLYAAANVLFRSRNGGASWEAISSDLTRNDPSKMGPSGGPITKDNTSVEYYGTIFAAVESPLERGVLWTGSDDGRIHVSRDGGASWSDVTPQRLPEWAQINSIEAHPFEAGGLYVAATRYKLDDFRPYLLRTTDWGKSWELIVKGIPEDQFTRVIRADPERRGLLYAGTERGVFMSFDDGGSWESLQVDLPIVPVTDLRVEQGDLVAATQGRGYWILDGLSVLHQLDPDVRGAEAHLFRPRPTYRLSGGADDEPGNMGQNPPDGVVFHFLLAERPASETEVRLDILEPDGDLVRSFTRKKEEKKEKKAEEEERKKDTEKEEGKKKEEAATTEAPQDKSAEEEEEEKERRAEDPRQIEVDAGLNRFVWNLRYPGTERFKGLVLWNRNLEGPRAVPGTYRAKLTIGDWQAETEFEVRADPRLRVSRDALQQQFDFLIGIRDTLNDAHRAIRDIRALETQLADLRRRVRDVPSAAPVVEAVKKLEADLNGVEEALYQTKLESPQDPLNFPIRLNDKLNGLGRIAAFGDHAPAAQMVAVRDELTSAVREQLERLKALQGAALDDLNRLVREQEIPAVGLPQRSAEPAREAP